ncbi:MAG: hypothetical protein COV76_07635 [Candidatus Omnitrophica bacterium CG11_big_fil_rev_8_21_14_0_20_64_10]|nr:MAG: hypothetical protein COV76_07635 [Candidatus Omnitrophica bacterium CG11_big_fil_rev_8_21_14_0_20_64_10]
MTGSRSALGRRGEEAAARFLTRSGYRILERNVRVGRGEVDLIARQGGFICFVEVKSAPVGAAVPPEEHLSAGKRRQLVQLAARWLAARGLSEAPVRFDVAAVTLAEDQPPAVRLIPGAFDADGD